MVANIRGNFIGHYLLTPSPAENEQSYAIWNLYCSKDIRLGLQATNTSREAHLGFQVYGAIENLCNSRDSLLTGNPPTYDRTDCGRTFRVGIRYTFPHE